VLPNQPRRENPIAEINVIDDVLSDNDAPE
jgi:hypothetical protein